ncbi:MAG TPA: mannosyltransferase family protein [Ktedonobacterales bacterium]
MRSDGARMQIMVGETDDLAVTLPRQRVSVTAPRLLDRLAWRDAALAWIAQRILFVLVAYFGRLLVSSKGFAQQTSSWPLLFKGIFGWDASLYATIAREGYAHPWESAFYPVLPGLEHLLMGLVGNNPALAGLIAANVATLLAFGLLRVLVERELGRATARRTLLYLSCFPASLFLVVPYTESLFLLFSLASAGCWLECAPRWRS